MDVAQGSNGPADRQRVVLWLADAQGGVSQAGTGRALGPALSGELLDLVRASIEADHVETDSYGPPFDGGRPSSPD